MLVFQDIVSGKDFASDSYPMKKLVDGAVLALESKKIQGGGDKIDTGANASAEEADEGTDDQVDMKINIVHAHQLQHITLQKKDYKVMQKQYWKLLKEALDKKKNASLGFAADHKAPADKAEAKKEVEDAVKKLKGAHLDEYKMWSSRFESYKKNFEALQKWMKETIEDHFDSCDFYLPPEAELGSSMIIASKFEGEALAPTFFVIVDGVEEFKY